MNYMKIHFFKNLFVLGVLVGCLSSSVYAQIGNNTNPYQVYQQQMQGLHSLIQPGQLADTLSLWGNVVLNGRILVPRDMSLVQLLSYAGGPGNAQIAGGNYSIGRQLNWSHEKVYVRIDRWDTRRQRFNLTTFTFQDNRPLPVALHEFQLRNNDVISVQVRQKPSPLDYIQVFGITIGSIVAILFTAKQFGAL